MPSLLIQPVGTGAKNAVITMNNTQKSAQREGRPFGPWRARNAPASPDPMMQADTAFFRRFPHRTIRMRPASKAEIARIAKSCRLAVPDGWRWFALAHRITPNRQARQFLMAPADTDCELSEEEARSRWDEGCAPGSEAACAIALARSRAEGNEFIGVRLPVGRGVGTYRDAEAAIDALDHFVKATGMVKPMVMTWEDGIHSVWPFNDVSKKGALFSAMVLGRFAELHGLLIDGYITPELS